jgi:hypothetical protein
VKRAIEEGFPIVEINRLTINERNAPKPIYQMHKWFARRASCVFRTILLGCLKPAGTDLMAEFSKDHIGDPDTSGKVILDPFMGGGTTVVEALRLGCKVIGIDLNPVAWFIVKTEIEPVDLDELRAAFDRLATRLVPWSGRALRETLLEQYKTACPCCGSLAADIIHTFWVKSAFCTSAARPCEKKTLVPLFSDYIVAQKSPSIRYWRDVRCPRCGKTFDWETEPATLVAGADLMVTSPAYSAGVGRTTTRWAYSPGNTVECPWCMEHVAAHPVRARRERKKVTLTVLLCPFCEGVWQWRGDLPSEVTCPVCHRDYVPQRGNVLGKGKFVCPACGTPDGILRSVRQLPEDQLLPMHPYAIQAYCAVCGSHGDDDEATEADELFGRDSANAPSMARTDHSCLLSKGSGKFFTRIRPADLARYRDATIRWTQHQSLLPYPRSRIPDGQETRRLLEHHYRYWHQMFNPRQLICLATLLDAIADEPDLPLQDSLLTAFYNLLHLSNMFCWYRSPGYIEGKLQGVFSRHDFQPKTTACEVNVWGNRFARGGFITRQQWVIEGKEFQTRPFDSGRHWTPDKPCNDPLRGTADLLPTTIWDSPVTGAIDLVVTDPPYAGNVNYAELSDFFYVWMREILRHRHAWFAPEETPKIEEIVENSVRGKSRTDFERDLERALRHCSKSLADDGLLAFTYHHSEQEAWESLLRAVCNAGFEIMAVYPVQGEIEQSLHLINKEGAISYDLIHVCRKRPRDASIDTRAWAGVRQEIRRRAREEILAIEAGRYGRGLTPADINIILIGKCLELYSRHYGAVVDHDGNPFELRDALKEIRNLVDQLVTKERPLPSELEDIDAESRIYLLALCDRKEVKADDLHKATRGVLEPDDLIAAGLIIKGRAGRGRTYEVKQPADRFASLAAKFRAQPSPQADLFDDGGNPKVRGRVYCIDYIHFLMALADGGEPLVPWLERFRGEAPRLRASCDYLTGRNKAFAPALKKVRDLLDVGPLFPRP